MVEKSHEGLFVRIYLQSLLLIGTQIFQTPNVCCSISTSNENAEMFEKLKLNAQTMLIRRLWTKWHNKKLVNLSQKNTSKTKKTSIWTETSTSANFKF